MKRKQQHKVSRRQLSYLSSLPLISCSIYQIRFTPGIFHQLEKIETSLKCWKYFFHHHHRLVDFESLHCAVVLIARLQPQLVLLFGLPLSTSSLFRHGTLWRNFLRELNNWVLFYFILSALSMMMKNFFTP